MKTQKLFLCCLLSILIIPAVTAQNIYQETFGLGGATSIEAFTNFDHNDITYSNQSDGNIYINDSENHQATYSNASVGNLLSINGGAELIISGFNTSEFSDVNLAFGFYINGSADDCSVEFSNDGVNWTDLNINFSNYSWNYLTLSTSLPQVENLRLRFKNTNGTGWKSFRIDDLSLFDPNADLPEIAITESLQDFGEVLVGVSSQVQSYTVNASLLTEELTITPPEGFNISLYPENSFTNDEITISPDAEGNIADTTIYIQFAPAVEGEYENIIFHKSFGTSASVTVSGLATAPSPWITVSSLNDFGNAPQNSYSDQQSYTLSGIYLESDVEITPPAGFEISLLAEDNFTPTSPITLSPIDGVIEQTTIYVRFHPTEVKEYSGNITHTSTGANNPEIAVNGTGLTTDPVLLVGESIDFGYQIINETSVEKSYTIEGFNLDENVEIIPPSGFEISTQSKANFVATNPIILNPVDGTINQNIYVRFVPEAVQNYTGNILHQSPDLTTDKITGVSGIGTDKLMRDCRIVDFGSDHGFGFYRGTGNITEPYDLDNDGNANEGVSAWKYSYTDELNPPPPFYDDQEPTAKFYGGLVAFFNKNGGYKISEGLINENHELRDDHNFMVVNSDNTLKQKIAGLWFWKKEHFLNGGDENPVLFNENSLLAVHISRYWGGVDGGRFVVQENGQFYISEYVFTDALRSSQMLRPDTTRWAEYNPSQEYQDLIFDEASAEFSEHTFTDIDAVGFYIFSNELDLQPVQVKWHSFEVYAMVQRNPAPSYHINMKEVPAGTYQSNNLPDFYLSETEIPYKTWKFVYEWAVSNQYCFDIPNSRGYVFDRDGDMGSMDNGDFDHRANEPATDMTWYDAVLWCNALSELEGLKPCYYADAAKTERLKVIKHRDYPHQYNDEFDIYVDYTANGFRLPTISEWGYAATNGTGTANQSNEYAVTGKTKTDTVGSLLPNNWGLKDMIGNVWEYTWDIENAGDYFDPETQYTHSVAGGGYVSLETPENAILPYGEEPFTGNHNIGFRVMRTKGGSNGPDNQSAGNIPLWTFEKDESLAPLIPASPNPDLIQDQLVYLSGNETWGTAGTPGYEDDNLGFTRKDDAEITVTPFYVSKYEISFKKWNEVYQWAVNNGYTFDRDGDLGSMDWNTGKFLHGANEPVTDIGWNDAALWCNALSEYEGKEPVYYADTTNGNYQVLRTANQWRIRMEHRTGYNFHNTKQFMTVYPDFSKNGYRLPTEAELEIVYRDGSTTPYPSRPGPSTQWIATTDANGRTHEIGLKEPNDYGVYDIAGNVEEWLWDWISHDYYRPHNPKGSGRDDPNGLFGIGVREGCFGSSSMPYVDSRGVRSERESAARAYLGFRVVRCDADEHPSKEVFNPPVVLNYDPQNYDMQTGKTFRNNLYRNGFYDKTGIPEAPVDVLWEFETGDKVQSSPILIDGILYFGSNDNHVYALDAASGQELWKFNTGGDVLSTPSFFEDVLYVGSSNGYLYAIHTAANKAKGIQRGDMKWRVKNSSSEVNCSPAIAYGLVFAHWPGYGHNDLCAAFDLEYGREQWKLRAFNSANSFTTSATIDTNTIYLPVRDASLSASSLATEYPLWRSSGSHCRVPMPIVNEDIILYPGGYYIKGVDRKNGDTKWSFSKGISLDRNQTSAPAVGNISSLSETLAVYAGLDADIYGLNAINGDLIWENKTDFGSAFESSPALTDNVIYVGNNDGKVYAIDAETGAVIWNFNTGDRVFSSPLPGDGVIYVGSDNGKMYALHNASANHKPTIDIVNDQAIDVDNTTSQELLLTGISDGDDGSQTLSITATSTNTDVISNVSVDYIQGQNTALLNYSIQGEVGQTKIYLTLHDSGSDNNTLTISFTITVDVFSHIQHKNAQKISVYPNPASEQIMVHLPVKDEYEILKVTDIAGKCIYIRELTQNQKQISINIDNWKSGIYFIEVKNTKGLKKHARFLKE